MGEEGEQPILPPSPWVGKGNERAGWWMPPNPLPLEEWVSVAPPPIPHPPQHPPPGPSVRLLPPFFLPCPFFFCAHLEASPRQENEEVPGEARNKRFTGILYPISFLIFVFCENKNTLQTNCQGLIVVEIVFVP